MPYINVNGTTQWGYDSTKNGPIGKDPFSAGNDPGSGSYVIPKPALGSNTSGGSGTIGLGSVIPGGGSVNISTFHSGHGQADMPYIPPAPSGPDLGRLNSLADKVERKKAIKKAMAEYDELSAATEATGFQSANNAGTSYSNRLLQQGITPLAGGVVAAQAKMPVYRALAEIGTEKEKTRLDAVSRADALSAQIASQIAGLQQNHLNTLADYNLRSAGYELDLNKFNASQEIEAAKLALAADAAARVGGSGGGKGGGKFDTSLLGPNFFPGYVGSFGPAVPGSGFVGATGKNIALGWG